MPIELSCPKCQYSLAGEVKRWQESCPLESICPECGLQFRWIDVFHPSYPLRDWCVEYCESDRLPSAILKTFVRSLWPPGFWKRLHKAEPVQLRRLGIYALSLIAFFWATHAAAGMVFVSHLPGHWGEHALHWLGWPFFGAKLEFPSVTSGMTFNPQTTPSTVKFIAPEFTIETSVLQILLLTALWPLASLFSWLVSKHSGPLRPKPILRAGIYSLCWIPVVSVMVAAGIWAYTPFSTVTPGRANLRPGAIVNVAMHRIRGVGIGFDLEIVDEVFFPLFLCFCFAFWWTSVYRAHSPSGKWKALVLTVTCISIALVALCEMRTQLFLVWLDVRESFR